MSIVIISDLHLTAEDPRGLQALDALRSKLARNCSELYILGDFFETWIGDDDNNDFIEAVVAELQAWRQAGATLYFMSGNRDFLLGNNFAKRVGWVPLPDPYKTEFYGIPVLLSHGDLLCTDDVVYQQWRQRRQQTWLRWLYLAAPLWLRRKIAQKARQKSKQHTQTAALDIMDVNETAVLELMQHQQTPVLIHGHTHRPGYHLYYRDHKVYSRITLSDWHDDNCHALVWYKDGAVKLS